VEAESGPLSRQWSARRFLSKANYTIHTDAIKERLSHLGYSRAIQILVYAQEADMLNIIVFGCTAKEWSEKTNAIGIYSKAGRYGGTYAHKDIAFNFGMWLSPAFQLYVVKEYQRLVEAESGPLSIQWSARRFLSKANYTIHTDAIKNRLTPIKLTKDQINIIYAEEADVLNMALFGMTAKDWKNANPDLKGNIRDYASLNELICLANLENINSVFINDGINKSVRLERLNKIAISQMKILNNNDIIYLDDVNR
jgi:hypothetical protein